MSGAEEDIDMESDGEGVDPFEYLGSLLQTEDGTSIADVLNKLASQLENQNKILIKMLSNMQKTS
jgi:mannitol/fructose-specific phosphotransferase system IIA component (Ntr-type)